MDVATLRQRQSLPLEAKARWALVRIREWAEAHDGDVYVSFSGGKDSTVLLDLVRQVVPDAPAVFCDTGLEFPEVKEFVRATPNAVVYRPKMGFREVLETHGYPVVSKRVARMVRDLQNPTEGNAPSRHLYLTGEKRDGTMSKHFKLAKRWQFLVSAPFNVSEKCCDVMKKEPARRYEKQSGRKPFIGSLTDESRQRETVYLKQGCNAFSARYPCSTPLAIWTKQDVLRYLRETRTPIASVYGQIVEDNDGQLRTTGEDRTGCVFCAFGASCLGRDGLTRFERLALTHPKLHAYCINDLGMGPVLDFVGVPYRAPAQPALPGMEAA
jgi:3'-phosphoadenosine 5'-phosphosulfate sulfotransferase (PAPS reductase)/FAD synthetase